MKTLLAILGRLLAPLAHATTSGIFYIYQPLTTLGTDQDAEIIIARIPVIGIGVPEDTFSIIAKPNKLVQGAHVAVDDSNLLSNLGISISAEYVDKPDHYLITLDVVRMKPTDDYDLTPEAVVKAAVDCIRRTIDEHGKGNRWKIKVAAKPEDAAKWRKYEGDYPAKRKK
jgi:hypothetical protein